MKLGALTSVLLFSGGLLWSQSPETSGPTNAAFADIKAEQQHFLECLVFVYSPPLWISYNDHLYFAPKTDEDWQRLDDMKTARAQYTWFTNRAVRHQLVVSTIASSGIPERWRQLVLLPLTQTNENLTPTFNRPVRIVPQYRVERTWPNGDALLNETNDFLYVLNYRRAVQDAYHTNALLIWEGIKTLGSTDDQPRRLDAFTDVGLNKEEVEVLRKISAAFITKALTPAPAPTPAPRPTIVARSEVRTQARSDPAVEQFQMYRARASDASPYMQFMLGKAYVEGAGTPKNEPLGLEWIQKAAANGSGDASAFLEKWRAGHK